MSDHPKQPKRNWSELGDESPKFAPKPSPALSLQPSRSTTPALSNTQGPSPGLTGILPPNPESAPKRVDNGEDVLQGGDTDTTDNSDAVHLPVGPTYGSSTFNLTVHGGTGGSGGQGGVYSGPGGLGEGPKITFPYSNVNLTNPDETKLQFIKEKLAGHVAAQHKFTDQRKSLCAPDTRVDIQADILKWLSPQPGTKEHIFWITGIAGSGKSTLSATVVESLRQKPHTPVAAQFFISRNIPETIDPAKIIPTIALQLAEFSPAAAGIIHDVLERGFPPTREKQVAELLLAPIRELSKSRTVVIILIDALDELQTAARSVMEILSPIAPRGCELPDNIRFLITSRPEHWADISRSETLELAVFKQCALETESSVYEVHNFIVARMKEITPSDWDDWPTTEQLVELSGKANGLFHYAATALQWITQQIDEYDRSCRSWVLNRLTQEGGLNQLEDLYKLILTSFEDIDRPAQNAQRRAHRLAAFRHVIGTILMLHKPLTIRQLMALLADIQEEHLAVKHFLQHLRSVLIPGITASFEDATPQMHKSFRDYIMDVHAPAEFRILTGHAHFVTARSCLEVIVKAGSQSDVVVKYSVQYWYQHLRKAVEAGTTWEDERMWNLFGQMAEEAVVSTWAATDLVDLFADVAAAGWGLLKQNTNADKVHGISRILKKAKEREEERELEEEREEERRERRRECERERFFEFERFFERRRRRERFFEEERRRKRTFFERERFRERERRRRAQRFFEEKRFFSLEEFEEELELKRTEFKREEKKEEEREREREEEEKERKREVHTFPPLPIFVLLTFSCHVVFRKKKCMLFPHCPCLSCSLFLAFSSLETQRSACFSHIAHVCLDHFFSSSLPIHPLLRFGIRAFFKLGKAVNSSPFHRQDEGMDPFDHGF